MMAGPPAVHRYHTSMAGRVQALARHVLEVYGGDAGALWRDVPTAPSSSVGPGSAGLRRSEGQDLRRAARQAVRRPPAGWEEAAGDYAAPGRRSVADVVDATTLQEVRDYKKAMRARARAQAD
jgi:hypothetical protein